MDGLDAPILADSFFQSHSDLSLFKGFLILTPLVIKEVLICVRSQSWISSQWVVNVVKIISLLTLFMDDLVGLI